MRTPSPFCRLRDHDEFTPEGDAGVVRPPEDAPIQARLDAGRLRDNLRGGPHQEPWRHVYGCGAWLAVERDTQTHAIGGVRLVHPGMAAAT